MRIITLSAVLALVAPVPAMADASLSATVKSGAKTTVAHHSGMDKACKAQHIVIKMTTPPTNGDVTTQYEDVVVPAKEKLGGVQPCVGKTEQMIVVYYQSKAGFKGTDTFKYQRTNEDNPKDKLNGVITLTVTVQ